MNTIQSPSFRRNSIVQYRDREWRVLRTVSPTELMLEDSRNKSKEVVGVADLLQVQPKMEKRTAPMETLHETDLAEARRRLEIIRPVLTAGSGRMELVGRIAAQEGIGPSTLRRWYRAYENTGHLSDLAPIRRGRKMPKKLDSKVEALIERVIDQHVLSQQNVSVRTAFGKLGELCRPLRLKLPHEDTFRRRVAAIPERLKVKRRRGRKAAHDAFGEIRGRFPGADYPLAVVEIDHTKLDIILVDQETRQPIGRPWLTLAIDVYSRMIVGYWLSLDPPSAFSVGMCIANAVLTKDTVLHRLKVNGEWPVWGLMKTIHSDNGKEFRSLTFTRSCEEYGISIEWRPVKQPHFGGHIERLMGTVAREIHTLPGTTFSNPRQKGEYKSAKKAVMAYGDLEAWLVNWIVNVYHQRIHSSLGYSPMAQWRRGIVGDGHRNKGIGLPEPVRDPQRFVRDFLPQTTRCVTRSGVTWDKVVYMSDALRPWIDARKGAEKVKFVVRRDPRDISRLYFLDPELKDYLEVPYRNPGSPSLSIWEYREAERWSSSHGMPTETAEHIFAGRQAMDGIVAGAAATTRKARSNRARRKVRAQQGDADLMFSAAPEGMPSTSAGNASDIGDSAPIIPDFQISDLGVTSYEEV